MQSLSNVSRSKRRILEVAAFIALVVSAVLASRSAVAEYDLASTPYLLGDWGGLRTRLSDDGVDFTFGYVTESAHNFTGGTEHLTRYTDQLTAGVGLNLGKLMSWQGALFHITITDRNGQDLNADAHIGNNQLIQEVYGRGQTWHLTDLTLQQNLMNDRLSIKVGRMPVGEEFASFSCDFQNLTFCGAPPGNIVGTYWVNWPTSLWAAVANVDLSTDTYLQLGGYQVAPLYIDNRYAEEDGLLPTFPSGTTGALIPLEFGWLPHVAGLPGNYKIGGWYNISRSPDLYFDVDHEPLASTGAAPLEHKGAYGGYLNIEQQVSGVAGGRGASFFLNLTMADKDTSATNQQIAAGTEYKGPFNRPDDMIGFAVGATHANGRYGDYQRLYNQLHADAPIVVEDGYEYVSETFYSWSPVKSVALRPNVQYILHPGGAAVNRSAVVLGLKTIVAF